MSRGIFNDCAKSGLLIAIRTDGAEVFQSRNLTGSDEKGAGKILAPPQRECDASNSLCGGW
jgi:hypothetical protein